MDFKAEIFIYVEFKAEIFASGSRRHVMAFWRVSKQTRMTLSRLSEHGATPRQEGNVKIMI